jgi:hypothetical protein
VSVIEVGGDRPYQVLVGRGLLGELPAPVDGAARVAVLFAPPLKAYADEVAEAVRAAGARPLAVEVPDPGAGKTTGVNTATGKPPRRVPPARGGARRSIYVGRSAARRSILPTG